MSHRNKIIDADAHFVVNAITRQIENKTPSKITLMQNDHNSERFTFTLPRYIEGHDMLEVSKAEVHFINTDLATKENSIGPYRIKDLAADPKDENKVVCSWLVRKEATRFAGPLTFQLKFICFAEDGFTIEYEWNTFQFVGISVSAGLNNSGAIAEENVDVLEQWRKEFIQKEEKNIAGGVAGLDENGKIHADQIGIDIEDTEQRLSMLHQNIEKISESVNKSFCDVRREDETTLLFDTFLSPGERIVSAVTQKYVDDAIDNVDEDINEVKKDIYVKGETYENVELTIANDGFYHYHTGVLSNVDKEQGTKQHASLSVKEGEIYRITVALKSALIPAILFYDANGTYLSWQEKGSGSWSKLENYVFEIPANVATMIVQSSYATPAIILEKLVEGDILNIYPKNEADVRTNEIVNSSINSWKGKTLLTYGDSITAYGNGNGTDKGWQRYLCEHLGFSTHYGRGVGGQTFIYNEKPWVANADGTFNSRDNGGTIIDSTSYTDTNGNVQTVSGGLSVHYGYFASWDRIKTMIPDDIKDTIDVIFMFGVNDAWKVENVTFEPPAFVEGATKDTFWANAEENTLGGDFDITTFVGAVASTIMKLQARCPNALIVMGTTWSGRCLEGTENTAEYDAIGKLQWKEGQIVKEIANYFSIPCVDIWGNSGVNQLNRSQHNTDNVHPNSSAGYKALARTVISGLRTICPKIN